MILLGVTGSISAYKACDIVSTLKKETEINVIMTKSATKFVTPLTFQVLSNNKVYTDTFDEHIPSQINHIELGKKAKLFIIAPASANTIAKIANGLADDMLSSTALALPKHVKKLIAPSMNMEMFLNSITKKNLKSLEEQGYKIIQPQKKLLACGDFGIGALAEVEDILDEIKSVYK
ncbi:MAG: phosphopantothenoylcysteine decarboxylase [Defluviitaleaceae bacterium]|nr:phosphopantothenoylcysteine decarboxylase [Defluviitaleaceae bacterium]